MDLSELNHWWVTSKVRKELVPKTHRELFYQVKKDLKRRQIQILIGLRRTGKSTILFQLIDHLIKNKVKPFHILYCSFDEPEFQEKNIDEILREYSRLTDVDYKKEKIYLFLDEIQKSENWTSKIKLIYDNLPNVKILISGSASLHILSEAKKNLAGRTIYYELKPLNFKEFLYFKNIKIDMNRFLLYRDILEKEFEKFFFRHFPEIVKEKNILFVKSYIRNSIIEPIILKDLPKEFEDVDIILLEKIINIFLTNPGQYLIVDDLAKDLKRSKTTIYKALFYLEFSFLFKRVLNYRPSLRIASRKLSRIYAYHHSIAIPFNPPEDRYVENMVMSELDAKYYWREKDKEVDFLKDSVAVEVKYKTDIKKQDIRHVNYFLKKYGDAFGKHAYVITKNLEKTCDNIKFMPLWKFCLIGLQRKM